MYPHRIRLRGPWECEPLASDLLPRRVFMPSGWLDAGLAGFRGKACFSRKFGYPGNADPATEHIWLTCDGLSGCRTIVLNGKTLSEDACTSFSFDVTKLLAQRNKLDVTIEGTNETEGLWGEVALEIRKDAYLSKVRVERADAAVRIVGRVVGIADRPLELYTMIDGKHADYRTIAPTDAGAPFEIDIADANALSVRLDLIHVSTIWYAVELPLR
jgi:hypothetical protein